MVIPNLVPTMSASKETTYLDPLNSIGYLSRINFRAFSRALAGTSDGDIETTRRVLATTFANLTESEKHR